VAYNKPWSKIRKELEQDFLCDSLKGRVRYYSTTYNKAHDHGGRVCILVDNVEKINMHFLFEEKTSRIVHSLPNTEGKSLHQLYDEVETELHNKGEFEPWNFSEALNEFFTNSIDKSLNSNNWLVRILAIFDRRVGKRRLEKLKPTVNELPEWLQYFYNLRFESEGIS